MKRRFIVDENLPERIVDILQISFKGLDVTSIKRHHECGTKDTTWMRDFAEMRPQPIILTCDRRIKTRKTEREALKESGLTYVIFLPSWMDFPFHEQAWRLLKIWPDIQDIIGNLEKGNRIVEVDVKKGSVFLQ